MCLTTEELHWFSLGSWRWNLRTHSASMALLPTSGGFISSARRHSPPPPLLLLPTIFRLLLSNAADRSKEQESIHSNRRGVWISPVPSWSNVMDAKPFVLPRQYYRLLLVSPLPSASLRNKRCYPNIMTCFCSVTTPNNLDLWLYNRIATAASCARPEPGLDVGPLTLPANKRSGYPVRGVATACRRWQKRKYPSMVGVFDHNQQWLKTFLTRMLASPRGAWLTGAKQESGSHGCPDTQSR